MNKSNYEHILAGLCMQSLLAMPLSLITQTYALWIGWALATGFFLGREHSQREFQITKRGPVGGLKWYEGFHGWSSDAKRDFWPTTIICALSAAGANILQAYL